MKKLISLLLAVSVMAASTVAFAADLTAAGNQRNDGYDVMPENYVAGQIATYRPGDTITFSKGAGVTFAAGDDVTFISSKVGADIDDTTVMFIDQVKIDSTAPTFTYKIREGLAEGQYKLKIKIGDQDAQTFFYAIGDPKVEIAYVDAEKTTQYYEANGVYYYFALATMGSSDVTFDQAGVDKVGFKFNNSDDHVYDFDAAVFDEATESQNSEGIIDWWLSIGIENDADDVALPVAEGVIINK